MPVNQLYKQHPVFKKILECFTQTLPIIHISGLTGSARSLFAASVIPEIKGKHIFLLPNKESAAFFANDLVALIDEKTVAFFPSSYKRPGISDLIDESGMLMRTELLNRIISTNTDTNLVIVSYPESIAEQVLTNQQFSGNTFHLSVGEKISQDFLKEVLLEYSFQRVDFVYGPGQYAVRGSIIDVFSYADEYPYRIDFFGNEVESIRKFNLENQLSVSNLNKATIVPDLQRIQINKETVSLFEFCNWDLTTWMFSTVEIFDIVEKLKNSSWFHSESNEEDELSYKPELLESKRLKAEIKKSRIVELAGPFSYEMKYHFEFRTTPQPAFNKNFELLASELHKRKEEGFENYILSENNGQFERLAEIFSSIDREVKFTPINFALHEGFIDFDLNVCLFTDHEIFERYHKYKLKQKYTRAEAITLSELSDLHPGDYVVHIDHGIGKFGGIEKVETNNKLQEVIKLVYQDNDVLYISIHSLHRISKYKSKEGSEPKIHKLGSGAWAKLKATTKSKVKDIARDLIALYAKRKASKGFQFSADNYMQQELEASFLYEDTPDQAKATLALKKAMEQEMPMDMLICGDVGFGKTEVAIRGAFKAVCDSKQVAVLVPTTILALQHYKTFTERLKGFPCNIDFINRFKSAKEQKETIKRLSEGKIDIIIGTHRLVSTDVKFKDLGLLIIDEEQKFGVSVKEKLKNLKTNVDTLTLTATPIPRTLQFSLMGARDLAIINTPPPNRHPIVTEIHTFNEDIIREGIRYEIERGGQVFFINNRIQNIAEIEKTIRNIIPEVRTIVAHGQMEGELLEKIILEFIAGDHDVLIATSIIESGLDIPNANTIFINDAHHFGLSDLHQLRGRVGRSNRKAFCNLLVPPLNTLTQEARRRLKALEDFSELGSGFNISLQDLDIRGAGNLLGAEQSGFIAEIGFETYQKILNETLQELRESEFNDVFDNESATDSEKGIRNAHLKNYTTDCQIETDLEIMIPEYYVENISERIKLYRELDNIEGNEELLEFSKKLEDRFGEVPSPVEEMMNVVRLRRMAMRLGIERIVLRNNMMNITFVSNQNSPFYQSDIFSQILNFVQKHPKLFQMKEGKEKLSMSAQQVFNVAKAIDLLSNLIYEPAF